VCVQELPEKWTHTKKIAITVKQQVAPLQANEVANVRKKAAAFDTQQHFYREQFRKGAPFWYNCTNPYEEIDKVSRLVQLTLSYKSVT